MRILPTFPLLWRCEKVSGGAPCLRSTGILVEFLVSRFVAGEPIGALAADYGVSTDRIQEALRFALYVKGTSLESKAAWTRIAKVLPETRRPS